MGTWKPSTSPTANRDRALSNARRDRHPSPARDLSENVAHNRTRPSPQQRTQRTMTKLATLALVNALLAVSLAKATAQPAPPGSLVIAAEGRTLAPYDMISLDVSIEVRVVNDAERERDTSSASLAQTEHSQASEVLLKTLNEDLGFPIESVTTGSMNLSPITLT